MPLSPYPNPWMGFQASIPRALLLNPSTWGTPEPQNGIPPAPPPGVTLLFGDMQNAQICKKLALPLRPHPHLQAALDTNTHCDP